tara:strand:- start:3653 stop:4597 length:945 start_codon:yes stop_codon:yes gene_type:complete
MAQPADTFSSYDAVGNREDLADFISMISPTATPFQSGIATVPATSTKHEWQTDSLAAASGTNAVIEGDDATTDASTATSRVFNYTQILDKVPRVTGTQSAMDSAGRADEMDYQIMKRTKEIKRDLETSFLANNAQVAGNDTTARELGGVESYIATNDDFGATGASPTGDGTDARTDGTQRAFTESQLKTVIASCFDNGGEPDTIMVGSFNKQALSSFSGGATRNINADSKQLVNAIDVYVSDFGTMQVVPNRFMRSRSALVLDMGLWKKADLRAFSREDLAKTGDTTRVQLLMETTLQAENEAGSGGVFDLTTS